MTPIVIQINTLAEFQVEIPPPAIVRLDLTESTENTKLLVYLNVHLDLQAVSSYGDIVWLHDTYTLEKSPGGHGFWRERDKSIYSQLPQAFQIISDELVKRGYEVRRGRFGIAKDIQPVRGNFECIKWVRNGEEYTVERRENDEPGQ